MVKSRLPEPMRLNKNKAKRNLADHQISFEEAAPVFSDEWAIQEYDESYSDATEKRFTIVGLAGMKFLRVTYANESDENGREIIKLISAREAKGLDRKDYETKRDGNSNERNRRAGTPRARRAGRRNSRSRRKKTLHQSAAYRPAPRA